MNPKHKEYLISALNTFVSAFLLAILAMPIDFENLTRGTIIALALTGARAWIKAVQQYLATKIK